MQKVETSERLPAGTGFGAGRLAYPALVLAVLFWSGNFVAGRALGGAVDPVQLNALRWAICILLFAPFVVRRIVACRREVAAAWPLITALGVTGIAGFHTMVYAALRDTTAVNALLMLSLSPAVILIGASILTARFPTRLQVLGTAISFAGVAAVLSRGEPARLLELELNRGDLWMLGAVVVWSAYSLLLKRRPQALPQDVTLASSILVALVLLIPGSLVAAPVSALVLSSEAWLAILYIAVFASLIAFLLWSFGLSEVGPEAAGQFIHLMPIFGAALAVLLLGERIAVSQIVGAVLVLTGIVLVNRRSRAR